MKKIKKYAFLLFLFSFSQSVFATVGIPVQDTAKVQTDTVYLVSPFDINYNLPIKIKRGTWVYVDVGEVWVMNTQRKDFYKRLHDYQIKNGNKPFELMYEMDSLFKAVLSVDVTAIESLMNQNKEFNSELQAYLDSNRALLQDSRKTSLNVIRMSQEVSGNIDQTIKLIEKAQRRNWWGDFGKAVVGISAGVLIGYTIERWRG